MATTSYRKGQEFIVYHDGERIACSRNCSLEVKSDTIETSSPSTGTWRHFLTGKTEWAVSVSGLISIARNDATLFKLAEARTPVELYYADTASLSNTGTVSSSDTGYFHGQALIESVSFTGEIHKTATYTAKFKGTGVLEYVD